MTTYGSVQSRSGMGQTRVHSSYNPPQMEANPAVRARRNYMDLGASYRRLLMGALAVSSLLAGGNAASAQVVTGELGEPSATTTVSPKQLPAPPPPFGGVIKETLDGSKTWWPPRIVPPKGAPNVLLIMTDDQGYGVPGTFGGVIP